MTRLKSVIADELCEEQIDTGDGGTDYCNEPATDRIKGEEDSFGSEWIYMCEPHAEALSEKLWQDHLAEVKQVMNNPCGRCKTSDTGTVIRWHLPDEPSFEEDVFWCSKCREAYRQELREETCGMDYRYARQSHKQSFKCYCGVHSDLDYDETVTEYVMVEPDDYW